MKPEIKARWTAALRSGEYEQGSHCLHGYGKFCCLGVLCDLHAKEFGGEWQQPAESAFEWSYLGEAAFLPGAVMVWAGLIHPIGAGVTVDGNYNSLVGINDNGTPFLTIADIIEAQV